MQLLQIKTQRWASFLNAVVTIGLVIVIQSCTKAEDSMPAQNIHRLKVVDENFHTANQPLHAVLDLDYNENQSSWTWREVLLSRLRHHQFEDLDKFADEVRATRARFPGGGWKLSSIYDDINEPSAGVDVTDAEWEAHLKLFEEWIAKYPTSVTARAGYAEAWVRYAWHARGVGPARELTPTQRGLFAERLKRAKEVAVEALTNGIRCPHLYAVLLNVGQGQGWNREEYDRVFNAAIAYEPLYRSFYHRKASYLLPRWYGRDGDWQAFAEESADRLGGDAGADVFFFLYSDMASYYYGERDLAGLVRPVWNRLKEGFDAGERLHGVTADQRTTFGHYAYLVGERETVQTVLDKLGNHWNQGLWGSVDRDHLVAWVAENDRRSSANFSFAR